MGKHDKNMHMVAFLLLVVGGLNYLLIGLFGQDVLGMLGEGLERIVYILVGIAAVYEFAKHKSMCKMCKGGSSDKSDNAPSSQSQM